MSIFEKGLYMDPKYNFLENYVSIMYRGFWTPAKYEKLIAEVDAPYFFNVLPELDQEVIKRAILAASMVENKVKTFWSLIPIDFPHTIIGDIGGLFSQSEVTHRRSYFALAKSLKVDTDNIEQYEVLRGRVDYLTKHLEVDPKIIGKKRILKKLLLFTSLVEKGSLFTQFYILMSYSMRNRGLKTIAALQESTAKEENIHYSFGIDLINIIKGEHPQLWDEYLIDLVTKNIAMAYNSELKLIDWFFEQGVPEHLTREEVVNFLGYNFNLICADLGLDMSFDFDEVLYDDKNAWFKQEVFISTEPDFFDNAAGGYASDDEEVDVDSIFDND
jgi:ribonucleoside-diphosphate reductase beta chain